MLAPPEPRGSHPCLERGCGHPERDHLLTPELAGPAEVVVWCVSCRRHEVRQRPRWNRFGRDASRSRGVGRAPGTGS